MGLPVGKTQICNMALYQIGQAQINSIDPPANPIETMLSHIYDAARQEVLSLTTWNFAKKRAVINRSGTPEFDYTDAYALPNDFIRFCNIDDGRSLQERSVNMEYDLSNRQVLLNNSGASTLNIRYVADITDITKWDPLFRELVILQIATKVCYGIAKREKMVERLETLFARKLSEAMGVDGQQRPPFMQEESALIAARQDGYYRDFRYHNLD